MQKWMIWPTLAILLLISGCSTVLAEPENLITPPANDQQQFQERKLITSMLSDDEHITVPIQMMNPAPSVDTDITSDGRKEKIVFWVKNNGYQVGVSILQEKSDGVWRLLDQKRLSGRSIAYFNQVDIDGDGLDEIFLGIDSGGYNTLYIYRAKAEGLQQLDQVNYSKLTFARLKADKPPVLLCALSDASKKVASSDLNVYEWQDGGLARIFQQRYDGFCQEMDYGKVQKNKEGLYLALSSDYNSVNVILLLFDGKSFREQLHQEVIYVNALAERPKGILQDVNGDGIIDLLSIRPPVDASKREPREFLQVWRSWNGKNDFMDTLALIENKSDGYSFKVPIGWLKNIQYQYVMESGNSQLRFYDGSTSASGEPVLTIYARETGPGFKQELNKEYLVLGNSPANQRTFLARLTSDRFGGQKVNEDVIKGAFKVEGGQ